MSTAATSRRVTSGRVTARRVPSRRRGRRGDRGSASLELLAMIPIALTFAVLVLQVGGVVWAITSVNDAVRQGARADSLDRDGCAAAREAVPDTLSVVSCTPRAPSGVTLRVAVPVISDYLPRVTVTRTAVMP